MSDLDQQAILAQQELLREIRDELRATRSMNAAGSNGGMSGGAARPGHTFVAAQAAADRTLLGQWNTLGWSQAYQSSYRPSLAGDLAAISGFRRSPETLTQGEFEQISRQDLGARFGNLIGGLVAPGYVGATNALADQIHQNSGRFIRFGNSNAGALGVGLDYNVERSLTRQIQSSALGDMRLSGSDYSTIASAGMQSGQMDSASGPNEFMSKIKELASATGDLTRALHMSTQEISTAMGNMRQLGVGNVSQQRGVLMQLGGAAMVAGISNPEMQQFAGNAGSAGLQFGLSATTTMPAAANQAAVIRALSQSGIISPEVMAMGGGAFNISNNIMQAKMGFAASSGGYLSYMGGGAGLSSNSFSSMIGGLGATGMGTFEGAVTMGMDRASRMQNMSPQQLDNLMRNHMESTMRLAGVTDMTSRTAQGMAFNMARANGMDEGSAMAFSTSEFSVNGRRAADFARMQSISATRAEEMRVGNDMYAGRNSFAGRMRGVVQDVEQVFGGMADSAMSGMDRTFGLNAGADFSRSVNNSLAGNSGASGVTAAGFLSAQRAGSAPGVGSPDFTIRNHSLTSSRVGAGLGGVAMIAGAAFLASNPLGWGILGLAAAGAAFAGTPYIGAGIGSMLGDSEATFDGNKQETKDMLATHKAIMGARGSDAQKLIASNSFKGAAWEKLTSRMDRSATNAAELQETSGLIAQVAHDTHLSIQDVANGFTGVGGLLGKADVSMTLTGNSAQDTSAISNYISGFNSGSTAMSDPESLAAVSKYMRARASGASIDNSTLQTVSRAVGSKNFDAFSNKVTDDLRSTTGRAKVEEIARAATNIGEGLGNAQFNRAMSGALGLAESYLNGSGLSAEDQKSARTELDDAQKDSRKLLDSLHGGKIHDLAMGGKLGQLFKDAASVEDDTKFESRTAQDIANTYHLDITQVEKMSTPENRGKMKRFVEASLLGNQAAISAEQAQAAPLLEANILNKAADTLKQLSEKLSLDGKKAS